MYVTIYDTTQNFFTILTEWTEIVQTAFGVENTLKMTLSEQVYYSVYNRDKVVFEKFESCCTTWSKNNYQ